MNFEKINGILNEIEKRDNNLYTHLSNVAMLSYATAQELKLSFEDRYLVFTAGYIHDIAKYYKSLLKEHGLIISDTKDILDILNALVLIISKEDLLFEILIENENCLNKDIILLKKILNLSNEYDINRINGLTHEKTCKIIREKFIDDSELVTKFFIAIINNTLNTEYN